MIFPKTVIAYLNKIVKAQNVQNCSRSPLFKIFGSRGADFYCFLSRKYEIIHVPSVCYILYNEDVKKLSLLKGRWCVTLVSL